MTDPALIERITRSLAFMLRHQPEKFDLELDSHGFADLDEVVHALNERLGEPVEEEDVVEAVRSGDRPRYEIQEERIRALYGHSIPVEPGPSSKPTEFLFVAVPEQELERARRFGLRGGRRRFLHLAKSEEDACESGRRIARDYTVLLIRALDAWEEGIHFYDRQALWLAEEIPTHLIEVEGTYHDGTEPEQRSYDAPRERSQRGGGERRPSGRGRGDRGGRWNRGERQDRRPLQTSQPGQAGAMPPPEERARVDEGAPREQEVRGDGERGAPGRGRRRGGRGRGRDRGLEREERGFQEAPQAPERSFRGAPAAERESSGPPPAPAPPSRPTSARPAPARSSPGSEESRTPFGAGLDSAQETRREPARAPEPQRSPAPREDPPRDTGSASSDFGAGL